MHHCQRCAHAKTLARHERLLTLALSDVEEVARYNLTAEERMQVESEAQHLARLLDRVEREQQHELVS